MISDYISASTESSQVRGRKLALTRKIISELMNRVWLIVECSVRALLACCRRCEHTVSHLRR